MNCRTLMTALVLSASAASLQAQADSTAPRIRPDGGALTPVILTYVATLQSGTDVRPLGERAVQLARTTYAGLSAWEITETRGAGANATVDTLVADYLTLAPFHWGASQPMPGGGGIQPVAARVAAEFRGDTMFGVMSWPGGRRNLVTATQPGAYITAAHLEVALRGLPIGAANWRDSAWVLVSGVGKSASVAAAITVIGQETLVTTAGSYDCWIVSLTSDIGRTQYWVSKSDRIVVQLRQVVPETGALLQYQLSRVSH
jgi:hypothetical protein